VWAAPRESKTVCEELYVPPVAVRASRFRPMEKVVEATGADWALRVLMSPSVGVSGG